MNNDVVDLTNCDKEPIHIPGKIQSHGFLISIHSSSFLVNYVSENIKDYLGLEPATVLNMSAESLSRNMGDVNDELDLEQLLRLGKSQNNFDIINPYKLMIQQEPYYLIIHQSDEQYVLEFEHATLQYDIQTVIGKSISQILSNKRLQDLLENAALEVKNIIEYDRIMVYKFQEEGHGEVVAEVKNEELESFLGLHYPASDIPRQARELYKLNYTRIIADVHTEDSRILTNQSGSPLDLTYSCLRAVSPIHIQYLKNMGVESSFSISLICGGELWGLIACHNYSPKFIDYKAREGAKLIGQILSSALEYRESEEEGEKDTQLKEAALDISLHLEKDPDIVSALMQHQPSLLDLTWGTGVALLFEGHTYCLGETPSDEELRGIFQWLKRNMHESIYHTTQFPEIYSPAKNYSETASGILACMLSKDMEEYIIWFKPEQIKTINWAGNPDKPAEAKPDGTLALSPRNSFETWAQIVKNTSGKWSQVEISNVLKIREKIATTINKKANEIRLLNERLKVAYEELDTFSYTISHDLRTPLTSIKSYTELFMAQNADLDVKGKSLLDRVISGADKMGFLINEILKLARVGRSEIDFVKLNIEKMVREVTLEVKSALKADHVEVLIGDCPVIEGDQIMISQVFTNLISNAVKYASKTKDPKVRIEGKQENDEVIYMVKDNGIGIDVNYHDKVFELFKRMENVKEYEGTGVGLAIVKRIMERHHGRIWFESELGSGTVFYVAFKR